MSQNQGGRSARHHTPEKPGRPSLERPSLFAGMDNEPSTFGQDEDTQRVRILSTLESTRRPPRRGPAKIQGVDARKRGTWQTKALLSLMGLGVTALLISFVMVLTDGHTDRHVDALDGQGGIQASGNRAEDRPAGHAEDRKTASNDARADNPLAALIAPPQHTPLTPAPQQAAVIENVISTPAASDTGPAAPMQHAAPSPATTATAATTAPPAPHKPPATVVAAAQPKPTAPTPAAPPSPGASDTKLVDTLNGKTTAKAAPRRGATDRRDDDVALLEAVFAHTRPRTPPQSQQPAQVSSASVSDELRQRCGSLQGAEAATCRARICVQHPTAGVCHQD